MRIRTVVATMAGCVTLAACSGLKDALSAHSDSVARTQGQDLTVEQLSSLLGNAKIPVQITKQNAALLAGIWSDYHRLAYAAAHGDSMMDKVDAAVNPILNEQRVAMFIDTLKKSIHVDSATETSYNKASGNLYMARHILFAYPPAATQQQKDSVKKLAASIRPQVTAANFAAMAKKYSKDAATASDSGNLPPFTVPGQMIKEFANATTTLKPGEISGPVETTYGIHIIERLPWAEAKAQFSEAYTAQIGDSLLQGLSEHMSKSSDLQVKKEAPATLKEALKDVAGHHGDATVLATFNRGGKFTVADFVVWLNLMQPQQKDQVIQGLPSAPDSLVMMFTKNMALRSVILRGADSAKIDVPADQRKTMRDQFGSLVVQAWEQLGISPKDLADSAKSTGDKEKLAARRVDADITKFMSGENPSPFMVPMPIQEVLDAKYKTSVSSAGLDRTVVIAEKQRAHSDSLRMQSEPPSGIPMPGGPPGAAGGDNRAGQPPTSAPPPKKPPQH